MNKMDKVNVMHATDSFSKMKLPAYHLFKVYDECFLLETCTRCFYKIDNLTYEYLDACQEMSIDEVKKKIISEGRYSLSDIESVYQEIKLLSTAGLFDMPGNYLDCLDAEKILDEYPFGTRLGGIELSLANCCNFACRYCYCAKVLNKSEDELMEEEVAKNAVDMLLENTSLPDVSITLFGGEPLINRKSIDFIMSYAPTKAESLGKKVSFIMTTNGSLIDDKIVEYIVKYNFGLMISMDGPKELHNSLCPTKAGGETFDMVLAGIQKVKSRRNALAVRATITHPLPNIADMVAFFEKVGFTKIIIGPALGNADMLSEYSFTKEDFMNLSNQDEALLPDIIEAIKNKKMPSYFRHYSGINTIAKGGAVGRVMRCSAASSILCVDTDGEFYPCHRFIGMKPWRIGSLKNGLDQQACKNFWKNYFNCIKEHCGNCYAYPVCEGPCPWELATATGRFTFNDLRCDYIKRYMEQSVYIYFQIQTFFENDSLKDISASIQDYIAPSPL